MKNLLKGLTLTLPLILLTVTGCRANPPEMPRDPFTTTFNLGEEGRKISVSGDSSGHLPGKSSEFRLVLDNLDGDDPWQNECCILLIDESGIVKEITHQQFNVSAGLATESTFSVEFPQDYEGPLGLCVIIPQRTTVITTLWTGEKRNGNAGPWPNISTCPRYLTEQGSRELAEQFVRNGPTFTFDGISSSLKLVETLYPDIENSWQFVFHFESSHAGYGDRTGQVLAQVITPHEAIVTVEQGEVKSAVMDGVWDMVNQAMLEI